MLFNGLWDAAKNFPFQNSFISTPNELSQISLEWLPKPIPIYPIKPCKEFNADIPLDLSQNAFKHFSEINNSTNIMPLCSKPKISQCKNIKVKKTRLKFLEISSSTDNSSKTPSNGCGRLSYPREFKLMVIEHYRANGQNKYRTCKEFQITKSMLNGWLQKAEKIHISRPGALKSGRSGRRPQFPEIEEKLFQLYAIEKAQNGNLKISNKWIRETAKNLAKNHCSKNEFPGGMCQFSERWLTNFKKRYGIPTNWNVIYNKTIPLNKTKRSCSFDMHSNISKIL